MRPLIIASLILCCVAGVRAAEPAKFASQAEEIAHWVGRLAAKRFQEREEATNELLRIGPAALPALERSAKEKNGELVVRSQRLIRLLRQRDLDERLTAFLLDRDPANDHGLADWERFRKLLGNTDEVKQLFAEIQRSQPDLLGAKDLTPKAATAALQARAAQLSQATQYGQALLLGDVAGVLFFAVSRDVAVSDECAQQLTNFCHQASVAAALQNEARREPIKNLIGAWVARSSSDTLMEQSLQLAIQHDLPQGLAPAVRVLEQQYGRMPPQPVHPPHVLHYALVIIGKHGDTTHLKQVESALNDTAVCMQLQQGDTRYITQVRDVALSSLLDLSKQDCTRYGLPARTAMPYHFNPAAMGFKSAADRTAAQAKWKEFRDGMK